MHNKQFYLKRLKCFVLLLFTCVPLCSLIVQLICLPTASASVIIGSDEQQQISASDAAPQDKNAANATSQSKLESKALLLSQPLPDIVIGSIDDEQFGSKLMEKNGALTAGSNANGGDLGAQKQSDRHRYDQQTLDQLVLDEHAEASQHQQQQQQQHENNSEPAPSQEQKIEARNEQDSSTGSSNVGEQFIVDHRPNSPDTNDQQQLIYGYSSTQSPIMSTTPSYSVAGQPSVTASSTSVPTTMAPSISSTTNNPQEMSQQQQQPQQYSGSSLMINGQVYPQWALGGNQPQQQPQQQQINGIFYARPNSNNNQQQQQQQQQYGSIMSGSNQIVSVQHPNAMMSEQQMAGPSQMGNTGQPLASDGQQQQGPLILVGSPQSAGRMTLIPGGGGINQQQVQFAMGPNGRRASLSNWLRGLGSMLANIFNRRDHGGLGNNLQQTMQMAASSNGATVASSPSSSGSHWIQLGPSAPHWLTQAQSALQQLQQKTQQLTLAPVGANRFASLIQASPQQQQQQQQLSQAPQQLLGQQQQAASGSTMAMPGQQIQLQQMVSNNNYQQVGDLQASGSSNSYVTIQTPSGSTIATNQVYQSNEPTATMVNLQPQQQQQQQQMTTTPARSSTGGLKVPGGEQLSASATAGTISARQAVPVASQGNQQAQTTPVPVSNQGAGGNESSRYGRSSRQLVGVGQKPSPAAAATASTGPLQQPSSSVAQSNGNLPLAHYSQYAASTSA